MNSWSKFFSSFFRLDLILPILLIVVYLTLGFVMRGTLPSSKEIIDALASIYAEYGYHIVFATALIESLVIINLFVPGMVTIGFAAIFAKTGGMNLPGIIIAITLGAVIGFAIDYLLGYFGFSSIINRLGYGKMLEIAKNKLQTLKTHHLILGFTSMHIASFLSLAAGTINMDFKKFWPLATISIIFWYSIWVVGIYLLGDVVLSIIQKYTILVILLGAVGLLAFSFFKKKGV
ncbi:MAG: hypothetical protein V1808_04475 [Candidatus Daviesbacteria bacterium]